MDKSAFDKIVNKLKADGWRYEPPFHWPEGDGPAIPNPYAHGVGGARYSTLIPPGGLVKIAVCSNDLFVREGRGDVWWGDPTCPKPNQLTIAGLWVEPVDRRKGLASAALAAFVDVCRGLGIKLKLEAVPYGKTLKGQRKIPDSKLRAFYAKFGFESHPDCRRLMIFDPKKVDNKT